MPRLLRSVIHREYIVLSFALAFIGCYCGIHLCEQFRLCSKENRPKVLGKYALMMMMAISIGGVGIWTMHFVGMAAVGFIDPYDNVIQLQYRYDETLISLFVVIILCYLGIYICSNDQFFTVDKRDVIKSYVDEVRNLNISQIRNLNTSVIYILVKSLTRNFSRILFGGVITGAGVCIMHYIGMHAVVIDADIEWNIGVVIASILIAIIAASAAYFILFRLLAIYPNIELLRLASAIVATIAVNGMHYTGMAAATYVYHEGKADENRYVSGDSTTLITGAIIASISFVCIAFILVIADIRSWFYSSSETVRETDALINLLGTEVAQSHIVKTVLLKYNSLRSGNNQGVAPASLISMSRSIWKQSLKMASPKAMTPKRLSLRKSARSKNSNSSRNESSYRSKHVIPVDNLLSFSPNALPLVMIDNHENNVDDKGEDNNIRGGGGGLCGGGAMVT